MILFDSLTSQAVQASPRVRMHLDFRYSPEDKSQRNLNVIEPSPDGPNVAIDVPIGQCDYGA